MHNRLQVRRVLDTDGAAIGAAHAAAWLAAYTHIFEPDFLAAAAESRRVEWPRVIQGLLAAPNLLMVGEVDERVVAFIHVTATPAVETAEISACYCHPEAWGTGISVALMERTKLAVGERASRVVLWTARDAARARRFYEKAGFHVTGNTRDETLTNWTTGASADCPAVEYETRLTP